jgi:exodeoxyribonuclease V alpha subunit
MILDKDQQQVIDNFRKYNILIVSGGPGSGKTAIITEICNILDEDKISYALCGPTGKSAKRISELTKRKASTIHRLLKAGYGKWTYNKNNKLNTYKYIIIDEVSMVDVELLWHLLQSFPPFVKFILVGDVAQLPSVGPGAVLRDLIKCNKIPTYYLTQNHRQGSGSLIAENARRINNGELKLSFNEDMQFVSCENVIEIRERIPLFIEDFRKSSYNLLSDVQILTPQHNTKVGVTELNSMLRFYMNPTARPTEKMSVGDKVMQTTNNYQLNIYNGYVGTIIDDNYYNYKIKFFDGGDEENAESVIEYPKNNAYDLMLAYACTIHKYQGSEIKAGIVVVSNSHTYMWVRSLLYTAITRFKERCIILGDAQTFRKAILNTQENTRNSKLIERIRGTL